MENIYIFIMKSNNPEIDQTWGDQWLFKLGFVLQVGDIINFRKDICVDNLENDYNTHLFKVVQREIVLDEEIEDTGGFMRIFIEPVYQ